MANGYTWCCGWECGTSNLHQQQVASGLSFATSPTRGFWSAKSGRWNPSASAGFWQTNSLNKGDPNVACVRVYMYIVTHPNIDVEVTGINGAGGSNDNFWGIGFKSSDSTYRIAYFSSGAALSFGSDGFTLDTLRWHMLEWKVDADQNPILLDGRINGKALTQVSVAHAALTGGWNDTNFGSSNQNGNHSCDIYFDDAIGSIDLTDYPFGEGRVYGFRANADGTHTGTGSNFLHNAAGAAITSSTTDAYTLVDENPVSGTGDFINQALTSTTQYCEVTLSSSVLDSSIVDPPRVVVGQVWFHQAGATSGNSHWKWFDADQGTNEEAIYDFSAVGSTSLQDHGHLNFLSTRPNTSNAWTLAALKALRVRFGYSSDANPDQYWDGLSVEADLPEPPPMESFAEGKQAKLYAGYRM